MKTIISLILFFSAFGCSETKTENTILNTADEIAVSGMIEANNRIENAMRGLINASNKIHKDHFDSLYHHHNLFFWIYHTINITMRMDTHVMTTFIWVPYNPHADHSHHFINFTLVILLILYS